MESSQASGPDPVPRSSRLAVIVALVCVLLPAGITWWLIRENRVDVPFLDDWEFATLVDKAHHGTMTMGDLLAPHIEHRMLFPRLVFLATYFWGKGSLALSIWFSFATVGVASWCVFRLSRLTGWPMVARLLLVAAANLALFSPIQVQNWLWMVQVCYFLPVMGFYVALLACFRARNPWWRLLACGVPALVATLSFAHGILVPFVLLLVMAGEWWRTGNTAGRIWSPVLSLAARMREKGPVRRRSWALLVWAVVFGLVALAYFHNLHNAASPSHALNLKDSTPVERGALSVLLRPVDLGLFIVRFVATPFCRGYYTHSTHLGTIMGTVMVGVFFGICGYVFWHRGRLRLRAYAPWIACGLYALGLAAATGIGRIPLDPRGGGSEASMTLRYTTFGLHLYIALVFLVPMVIDDWSRLRRGGAGRTPLGLTPIPAGWLLAVAVALALPPWFVGEELMFEMRSARAQARAALIFCQQIWPIDGAQVVLETDPNHLLKQATILNDLGLLKPALLKDKSLDGFKKNLKKPLRRNSKDGNDQEGWFSISKSPWPDQMIVEGEARMAGRNGGPADAVLLTYRTPEDKPEVFAVILPQPVPRLTRFPRNMDFQFINRRLMDSPDFASWKAVFLRSRLPEGRLRIEGWALDSLRMMVYPIEGEERID